MRAHLVPLPHGTETEPDKGLKEPVNNMCFPLIPKANVSNVKRIFAVLQARALILHTAPFLKQVKGTPFHGQNYAIVCIQRITLQDS